MAFANISPIAVRPGYVASIQFAPPGGSLGILRVKTAQARETTDNHDTVGTSSPTVNSGQTVQQTSIQGKARLRLNLTAQYSAGGSGDPPQFTNSTQGNCGVIAQIGDIIAASNSSTGTASFIVEEYGNSTNESGTIDFDLSMLSNGPYGRYVAAING